LLLGALLPPDALNDGARQALITFFGLLSAGALPTLTLLLSVSYPSSYSVIRLSQLDAAIGNLLGKLLSTFTFLVAGCLLLIVAYMGVPELQVTLPLAGGISITDLPTRLVHGSIVMCLGVALDRL